MNGAEKAARIGEIQYAIRRLEDLHCWIEGRHIWDQDEITTEIQRRICVLISVMHSGAPYSLPSEPPASPPCDATEPKGREHREPLSSCPDAMQDLVTAARTAYRIYATTPGKVLPYMHSLGDAIYALGEACDSAAQAQPAPSDATTPPTDDYDALGHAMEILGRCVTKYSCEQAQAVAKVLRQWRDKWALAVDSIPVAQPAPTDAEIREAIRRYGLAEFQFGKGAPVDDVVERHAEQKASLANLLALIARLRGGAR